MNVRHYVGSDRPSFTKEMLEAFLRAAHDRGLREFCMWVIAVRYGLRVSELTALKVEDIRVADNKIVVNRVKGSKMSHPAVEPDIMGVVVKWLDARKKFSYARSEFLFPSQKQSRNGSLQMSRQQAFRNFQSICDAAGIAPEYAHPHSLKHHAGERMQRHSNRVEVTQQFLGHVSVDSTMVYCKPSQADVDVAAAAAFQGLTNV